MYDSVEIKFSRKKVYGCFVGSMMKLFDGEKKKVRSKVHVCVLELAPATGTVIPSLWTTHPFIHFHSILYRTRNRLFSYI